MTMKIEVSSMHVARVVLFPTYFSFSLLCVVVDFWTITIEESCPTAFYEIFRGLGSLTRRQRVMITSLHRYRVSLSLSLPFLDEIRREEEEEEKRMMVKSRETR